MMLRLSGQGKPLPPNCPYKGEWIMEGLLFLYRPTNVTSLGGAGTELTPEFQLDGRRCIGFNSFTLAFALGLGSEEIFEANRNGTLILDDVSEAIPTQGATRATRCVFRYRDRTTTMTIEAMGQGGNA
jgi:hypothetical protein